MISFWDGRVNTGTGLCDHESGAGVGEIIKVSKDVMRWHGVVSRMHLLRIELSRRAM